MYFRKITGFLHTILCFFAVFGVFETILVHGFLFNESNSVHGIVRIAYSAIVALYFLWVLGRIISGGLRQRRIVPDIVLSALLLFMIVTVDIGGCIVSFRMLFSVIGTFLRKSGITTFIAQIRLNPARVLLLSFLVAIIFGTALLTFPAATVDRQGLDFVDALFTSTSATCVTGLIVRDTGSFFTLFGQMVIALLFQVGGLGIMTLSTVFAMILGKRIGYRQEEQMRGILDQTSSLEMYRLIIRIVTITFAFESVGALLMFVRWFPSVGVREAAISAGFHSVSAFCNAGFSLYSDSLMAFAGDWYVNIVFMMLIVFGGLGFMVINDMISHTRSYNPFSLDWKRLTVHSKLVILTSAGLIGLGTLIVFFFEFDNAMLGLSSIDKLIAAAFQSVTLRTAGFNTIDISALRDTTLFAGVLFMFIGASPASTGGGIKTTTLAVLLLSVRSLLRSRDKVEVFDRTIMHQTVYKSIAIVLFSFTFLMIITMILLATQTGSFLAILFETASALGTVGLSAGITGELDTFGKILITILMYVGRIGPLTVALALGEVRAVKVEYPTARVTVG